MDFDSSKAPVKGALFFFDFNFSENLGDDFVLLTRGNPGQNGFMQIYLIKDGEGRRVRVVLQGDPGTEPISFDAPVSLKPD